MTSVPDSFPEFQTERLWLRQIVTDALENIFRGLSHPEVISFYGVSFTSLEACLAQMQWYARLEQSGSGIWWAICSRENGRFFGAGGLNELQKTHAKAETGLWLLPEYWGLGYL